MDAANRLFVDGCCVVQNVVSDAVCNSSSHCIVSRLDDLLKYTRDNGLQDDELDCSDICQRHVLRYDMKLKHDELTKTLDASVRAVIAKCETLHGRDGEIQVDFTGAVVSLPHAETQRWHMDGECAGAYTVFCPLVDIDDKIGGTDHP